jgi:hypothetical protein
MSETKDGGPAFPLLDPTGSGLPGMSLRDWFAGMALTSLKEPTNRAESYLAHRCYELADAMLAERAKAKP